MRHTHIDPDPGRQHVVGRTMFSIWFSQLISRYPFVCESQTWTQASLIYFLIHTYTDPYIHIHIYFTLIIYIYYHYYIRACVSVCMYIRLGARLTIYQIRHTSAVAAAKTLSHPHPISRPLKIKGFGRTKWI